MEGLWKYRNRCRFWIYWQHYSTNKSFKRQHYHCYQVC